jgi:putative tricarboxylic transport membrane protein
MLAFVVGEIFEKSIRQSLVLSHGNPLIFFTRPISLILMVVALFVIVSPLITILFKRGRLISEYKQIVKEESKEI